MKLIIDKEYEVMFHTSWLKAVYVGYYNCNNLFRTEEGYIGEASFHRIITTKHSAWVNIRIDETGEPQVGEAYKTEEEASKVRAFYNSVTTLVEWEC